MKKFGLTISVLFLLLISYLASPISYFVVYFHEPLTANEFLVYLEENGINPKEHKVYILSSALEQQEGINSIDFTAKKGKIITDTVFNTRFYACRALFDKRVKTWEFAGPRHPYD